MPMRTVSESEARHIIGKKRSLKDVISNAKVGPKGKQANLGIFKGVVLWARRMSKEDPWFFSIHHENKEVLESLTEKIRHQTEHPNPPLSESPPPPLL